MTGTLRGEGASTVAFKRRASNYPWDSASKHKLCGLWHFKVEIMLLRQNMLDGERVRTTRI